MDQPVVRVVLCLYVLITVTGQRSASETLQHCTNNAFVEGVVECFASKFEDFLPFQHVSDTDKGFSTGNTFKLHEPRDNVIRYNFIMPSISKRMTKSHHEMLDKLYDIGKAFVNMEVEVLVIEKLKHINLEGILYEYIVEIMHHIAPQVSKHASQFMIFAETANLNMRDLCDVVCLFPSSQCDECLYLTNDLPSVVSCLNEFDPKDFEDNARWVKCFYNCEDLIPISSCVTEHFSECGQWSIMSDLIIRGFADYTGLSDTCLVHVQTPDNDTLVEGGEATMVEFYTYMPPGALCIDFKGLSEPLGMFRALASVLGLLLGNSPECNVQIQMSMQNFWDDLLPHIPLLQRGRPKCHDKTALRQAVIGNHEHAAGMETCIINVTMDNWNSTHTVPIWPSVDLKDDGDVNTTFTLKLMVDGTVKYNKKIPIMIEDNSPAQSVSLCQSTGDPHLITFDGHYYNNLYDGYFYLYRNKELPYQVQVVYQRCTPGGNASCTCAVAVKSGDDVFTVSKCRGTATTEEPILKTVLYVNGDLTPGTRVFTKDLGTRFEVILPTGARADIVVNNGFLNVYFTPSTYDLSKTEGLCGVFDGDESNDLTLPNGTVYTGPGSAEREQPRPFSNAWRVPESERIFNGAEAESSSVESSAPFCKCNHKLGSGVECTCGGGELVETCDLNLDGEIVSNLTALMRRSEKSLQKILDIDMGDIDLDEQFEPPEITFDDNKIWNVTYANMWCEGFIESDDFVSSCLTDKVIQNSHKTMAIWHCEDDIAITDSDMWQWSALESIKKSCVSSYQREINLDNDTYTAYMDNLCINNCNGRGTCNYGVCECEPAYTGGDCSLSSSHQPVVVMDSSSKCDRRHEDCRFATVYGRNFPADETLTCRVQKAEIDRSEGTFTTHGEESEVDIMYISPYQVVCFLPNSQSYQVTLEHSGDPLSVTHSTPQPYASNFIFMAYDSACYTCDISTQSCEEKTTHNHCIIEEVCYASSEVNPDEECQYCNSTQEQSQWTWFTDDTCQKKMDEMLEEDEKAERDLIIRISVACILTAFIVLLTIILFLRSKKKDKNYEEDLDEFDTTDSPEKQKPEKEKASEGVSNPSFDKGPEEMKEPEQTGSPLQSPRLKQVQQMYPSSLSSSPSSAKDKEFQAAKQAALEGRKNKERPTSISSTTSNRSLGLGGGSSLAFSQYQHLSGRDGDNDSLYSSLDKGIGAHATPPISRRNLHGGVSVTTYF